MAKSKKSKTIFKHLIITIIIAAALLSGCGKNIPVSVNHHVNKITEFDFTPPIIMARMNKDDGNSIEIEVQNEKNQTLRFKTTNENELIKNYCDTVFILYEFDEQDFLIREIRYQKNGELIKDDNCESTAELNYTISDYEKLKNYFLILVENDGNKEFGDQIIMVNDTPISISDYWGATHMIYEF